MNILEVNNLNCSYTGDRTALEVQDLAIPAKKLTFLLGVSGVGKSTILETLGLMSNTIVPSPNASFKFHSRGTTTDVAELWNQKETARSDFRKENLSFIFQSTNLMDNMSVLENAKITQLIQGVHDAVAEQAAIRFLHSINLVQKDRNGKIMEGATREMWDKPPHAISGGQRQRLAFARAIATEATVLFADEPTGNLDAWNADNLVNILTSELASREQTAVIVTHDISLALNHAHQIILIRKVSAQDAAGQYTHGRVSQEFTFNRETTNSTTWNQSVGTFNNTLSKEELRSFMHKALEEDILSSNDIAAES